MLLVSILRTRRSQNLGGFFFLPSLALELQHCRHDDFSEGLDGL
jgi:hypothetical protein